MTMDHPSDTSFGCRIRRRIAAISIAPLIALACISNLIRADDSPVPSFVTVQWALALDPAGNIIRMGPGGDEYNSAFRNKLEAIVRGWHFIAGKLNGQAAPTTTTLTVRAMLELADTGDYRVHMTDAHTGAGYERAVAPNYPLSALRIRHDGLVILNVDYDAEGRVTSAFRADGTERGIDNALVRAALDAAKQWTFKPETVDGHAVAGAVVLPFCFSIEGKQEHCFVISGGARKPIESAKPMAWTSVVSVETTAKAAPP
jgi:TonB family protein